MQFILNSSPLPFHFHSKKPEGQQYYEWRYKQKIIEEERQQGLLEKRLHQIIKQENDNQQKANLNKRRVHYDGTFYEYNLEWKKKLGSKVDQAKKFQQFEAKRQEEAHCKKSFSGQVKKQLGLDYKGPIEGWQQRFQQYLRGRFNNQSTVIAELTFEPKINDRSRKMTQGLMGKVEDRLIEFGQFIKMKNQQEFNKMNSQYCHFGVSHKKYSTNISNQSDIFYRLYKQSQQTNRKKKQNLLEDQLTFQPRINKLPEQIEEKIYKIRKPLYYLKNIPSPQIIDHRTQKQDLIKTKGDFQSFLKRNQALLEQKRKSFVAMQQQIAQKQNLQKSECTFSPNLNSKSKRIQKLVEANNRKLEEKITGEIKASLANNPNCYGLQNIDISKLTLPECKETSHYDDSDSLSIYRIENGQRQGLRLFKKEPQHEVPLGNSKSRCQRHQRMPTSPKQSSDDKHVEDSIQKMKSSEWQTQLTEIQNHLQNMMTRAMK